MTLFWWLQQSPDAHLEFLPAYRIANSNNSNWVNASLWVTNMTYTFKNLQPFTVYNLTVYVRAQGKVYPPAKFITATTSEGGNDFVCAL